MDNQYNDRALRRLYVQTGLPRALGERGVHETDLLNVPLNCLGVCNCTITLGRRLVAACKLRGPWLALMILKWFQKALEHAKTTGRLAAVLCRFCG